MPNRDQDESYYEGQRGPLDGRDERPYRDPSSRAPSRSQGYGQQGYGQQGYGQQDFDRTRQSQYTPGWRSHTQDWGDRQPPQQPAYEQPRRWPRAEGYAQQRTDSGHRHESVFGEQEAIRQEWDRGALRGRESYSREPAEARGHYASQHDESSLGQQLRHASHEVVSRVKRAFRGPKGYKRSDERIREDVNDRLAHQEQIDPSDIEVKVEGGEVTLIGTVKSRYEKFRVEEIADDVSGVEEVHNQLRLRRDDLATSTARTTGSAAESPLGDVNVGRNFRA